jgi:hypothetical protein
MVKKIRVSRHGLTRCPSCKNHIRVAAPINKTICSFCETSLAESLGTDTGEVILGTRMLSGGSRALLAATILGLPMAACGGDEPVANDIVADVVEGDMPVALYGLPMDMIDPPEEDVTGEDVVVAPAYGLPMDMIDPPAEDVIEESDDSMPVALYGMPPAEDAGFSEDVEESDEGMPVALYGMPPAEDAGSSDDEGADVEETDDMPNMALYGLPPNDKEPS